MVTRLSAEMLVDMPIPQEVRISPDGSRVAVAVAPASKKEEHPVSAIWIAPADGSAPEQQVTSGLASDTKPRWSPGNDEIAFLSDRIERGTAQVFLLPLSGGEAQLQTEERGGVSDLCWLPGEGRRIAYLAVDARDEETRRKRDDEREDANVYGEFWPYARLMVLNLDSGESRKYDICDQHIASISPSPDGSQVAVTLWDTPEIDHILASSQLAVIDLSSGSLKRIGPKGFNADGVSWSADGRTLYFFGRGGETNVSSYQLWTVGVESGSEPVCLTAGLQGCVYAVASGRDCGSVFALVAEGTESAVFELSLADNDFSKVLHFHGDLNGLTVGDDGQATAALGSVAARPREVYVSQPTGRLLQVTNFHTWLDDIELGDQEVVHWERAGFMLDGILIWPAGKSREDGPLPTVVSIHGGPYGRWTNTFIPGGFGRWLAEQGYVVFLPNPRGGMGHGQAFAESVLHTVGDEDYLDIMAGLDMLVEQGIADPDRLGCGGWSQGGFMTAWIVGHTDRFKAGVMGAGVSDWGMMIATSDIPSYENLMGGGNPYEGIGPHSFDRQSPISYVHNASTPTLIVHGEKDERVPLSQGIFFHRGLRAYGVPTELVTYPREPHGLQERNHQLDLLRRIADWYAKWIPVESS